jgi:hypothetical protein
MTFYRLLPFHGPHPNASPSQIVVTRRPGAEGFALMELLLTVSIGTAAVVWVAGVWPTGCHS